jgi:uncharacterized membrane protein
VKFLKTTLLTGLYVLLPVLLLGIGLAEIAGLLTAMVDPIADMFPSDYFDDVQWPGILATLMIVAVSMLLGLLARLPFVASLAQKFETAVLFKVPMYQMLKIISSALIDTGRSDVSPALVKGENGGGDPCYVMEEHEDGMATVLLPWSPASFAGSIKVVPRSSLQYLGCSVDEYSRSISFMGVGIAECLSNKAAGADKTDSMSGKGS